MEEEKLPQGPQPEDNKEAAGHDLRYEIYEWVQSMVFSVVIGILVFTFVTRVVRVDGTSMLQTLQDDDLVVCWTLGYEPKAGDVVVFRVETYTRGDLIKRVIAVGGQTVDIDFKAGIVYVDGVALEEDYVNTPTNNQEDFSGPVTVPEGYIFCLGDNRNGSRDSRDNMIGLVDTRAVVGRAVFVLVPGLSASDGERHFERIGFIK